MLFILYPIWGECLILCYSNVYSEWFVGGIQVIDGRVGRKRTFPLDSYFSQTDFTLFMYFFEPHSQFSHTYFHIWSKWHFPLDSYHNWLPLWGAWFIILNFEHCISSMSVTFCTWFIIILYYSLFLKMALIFWKVLFCHFPKRSFGIQLTW